jgi:hypothetical protein
MSTPIIATFKEWRFDHTRYQKLLAAYPKLATCSGEKENELDAEDVMPAFKCAGHAYLGNRKDVAVKFLRAILSCSNVPDVIVCSAALFDAQIALDQNNLKYAAAVCKRLVECPQWVSSTELLRNLLGLINTRINIKADPNYPFPSMVGKKLEDIEWLNLRLHYGFRDGSFGKEVQHLFNLRKQARPELRVAVDLTLGELFYLGYENLDVAEDFFFSALYLCSSQELKMVDFYRPIFKIYYRLGEILLCNSKPFSAFFALLIGLPEAASTPEAWMLLSQTAILCVNAKDSICRETIAEMETMRKTYEFFYSNEANINHANEVIGEKVFRKIYASEIEKPAPSYNFAFICVQKACKILEGKIKNFCHLQADLTLMYVFLSLEQGHLKAATDAILNVLRFPNANLAHRNIASTYKAKLFMMKNNVIEAVNALNSIMYYSPDKDLKDDKKRQFSKPKSFIEILETKNFDLCYSQAFSFASTESLRNKFIYSVQKCRNEVRENLRAKQYTFDLKHPTDISPFGFIPGIGGDNGKNYQMLDGKRMS